MLGDINFLKPKLLNLNAKEEEDKDLLVRQQPMDEEQQTFFKEVLQVKYRTHANLGRETSGQFYKLYEDVFGVKKKPTSCSSCNKNMYIELLKVYESSCENDKGNDRPVDDGR